MNDAGETAFRQVSGRVFRISYCTGAVAGSPTRTAALLPLLWINRARVDIPSVVNVDAVEI